MHKANIILHTLALILAVVVLSPVTEQGKQGASLFPVYLEKKGGYIDSSGKVIISPRFEVVEPFSEGLAAVRLDGKWGYINQSGEVSIPPQFDAIRKFSEGLAVVLVDGKYGYLDHSGRLIIAPQFQRAGDFSEDLARVRIKNNWGYINKRGEMIVEDRYDYADDFKNGFAVVAGCQGGGSCKAAFIDKSGKQMFGKWFVSATRFSGGLAIVSDDSNRFSTIVHEELTLDNYDPSSGAQKSMRFEIIDSTGRKVAAGDFQEADAFSDGLAAVRINDKYGFINSSGVLVIAPQFDNVTRFSEGLAFVSRNDKRFYINRQGKVLFNTHYSDHYPFVNGLGFMKDCSDHLLPCKGGYMDKNGGIVWPPTR